MPQTEVQQEIQRIKEEKGDKCIWSLGEFPLCQVGGKPGCRGQETQESCSEFQKIAKECSPEMWLRWLAQAELWGKNK